MDTLVLDVPGMYGDHHVIEVRRLLMELSGVEDVYASSYLRTVEIIYDPANTDASVLTDQLAKAGYLTEPAPPTESGIAAYGNSSNGTFYRHTAAYAQTGKMVSFAQQINAESRPLIPCPGMQLRDEEN